MTGIWLYSYKQPNCSLRYAFFHCEVFSNWKLIIIFLKDEVKLIMGTVSSPNLLEDARNIDRVLATDGWQTLMTFTRESGREFFLFSASDQ